jgi:catechol 2,3-dioxygenase-like lactoylglutathione lyase family enzyme
VTPLGVLETTVYVDDLDQAEAFYTRVLRLELDSKETGRHLFFRCGQAMLLVFDPVTTASSTGPVPRHGATGPGHVALAATASDLNAWVEHVESCGVEIEARIDWPGGGRSIYFRDPAGNSLELTTAAIWGI